MARDYTLKRPYPRLNHTQPLILAKSTHEPTCQKRIEATNHDRHRPTSYRLTRHNTGVRWPTHKHCTPQPRNTTDLTNWPGRSCALSVH
jgi:hypothetical protein